VNARIIRRPTSSGRPNCPGAIGSTTHNEVSVIPRAASACRHAASLFTIWSTRVISSIVIAGCPYGGSVVATWLKAVSCRAVTSTRASCTVPETESSSTTATSRFTRRCASTSTLAGSRSWTMANRVESAILPASCSTSRADVMSSGVSGSSGWVPVSTVAVMLWSLPSVAGRVEPSHRRVSVVAVAPLADLSAVEVNPRRRARPRASHTGGGWPAPVDLSSIALTALPTLALLFLGRRRGRLLWSSGVAVRRSEPRLPPWRRQAVK
jgi:hypothetical protein